MKDKKVWLATINAIDELQERQDCIKKAVLILNDGMKQVEKTMLQTHEKRLKAIEKELKKNGKI
jgi:cell division protein ZapA (FtsZ GTPase activity inhibitor)